MAKKNSFDKKNLFELDKSVKDIFNLEKKNPTQYSWGLFNVKNNEIKIERWTSASGGKYPTQMLIGEILNDTTIYFHTKIGDYPVGFGKNKKNVKINEIYHFRQFSPKPDSTNIFIK